MHHGCRAWAGMTQTQIVHAVAICKQRLSFRRELSDAPADVAYFHLADACLVSQPPGEARSLILTAGCTHLGTAWLGCL